MQSVNSLAKPSAVHIQISNFEFEVVYAFQTTSKRGTYSHVDPLRLTLQMLGQLSGYCLSAASFCYAVHQ